MTSAAEETNHETRVLAPGLYLVATPIGNLEDITLRALRVLRTADRIACEDTRQTQKLLNHFQIATPTVSYHRHNEAARTAELVAELKSGARIALVSDAGTPGISDPGAAIAAAAIAAGIPVFPIPGANAALAALVASGLLGAESSRTESSAAFTFHGFLPAKEGQRRTALETLRDAAQGPARAPLKSQSNNEPVILSGATRQHCAVEGPAAVSFRHIHRDEPQPIHIFYEAPHRIRGTLADIEATFGPAQPLVLARELTKIHEEFLRGAVSDLHKTLSERPSIKGEFVLLLAPTPAAASAALGSADAGGAHTSPSAEITVAVAVRALMQSENLTEMDALKRVARARGLSKSAAYREWQRTK